MPKKITPTDLRRIGSDHREAGNESTAQDYELAASTIEHLAERLTNAYQAMANEVAREILLTNKRK